MLSIFICGIIGFGCVDCRMLDEQSRLEANTSYLYNFSQHALPVTDIACFLGGIVVSSSEDRTCKVRMQLYSALNVALCRNLELHLFLCPVSHPYF